MVARPVSAARSGTRPRRRHRPAKPRQPSSGQQAWRRLRRPAKPRQPSSGQQAWRRLRRRLQDVSPRQLLYSLLIGGTVAFLIWLLVISWSALLPFQIGAVLAYL